MWKHSHSVRGSREVRNAALEAAELPKRRRSRGWWVWQASAVFATTFCFIIASSCLLFGSVCRLFVAVSQDKRSLRTFVLTPYFIGGVFFTFGCAVPLLKTSTNLRLSSQLLRKRQKSRSEKEVERLKQARYWALMDHLGSIVAVSGGLFINVATYIDCMKGSKEELLVTEVEDFWHVTAPVMFGRALFMLSGYFIWGARNKSWSLHVHNSSIYFWWTSVLFWLGASGFYLGWFLVQSPFELLPGVFVKPWFGVVFGYILGAILLFAASYIMMLELAHDANVSIERQLTDAAIIRV